MKYKCFCHRDNYWDLTKEEISEMTRGRKRIDPADFVKYYKIPVDGYYNFLITKGLKCTRSDRALLRKGYEEREKRKNADENNNSLSFNWRDVNEIPKELICAFYNVDFEEIDKKRYYDVEQLRRAKEDLQNKIDSYYHRVNDGEEKFSSLKHYDLVAMRIFRGYSKKELAKMTELTYELINTYERKGSRVPKYMADAYINTLKIKKRHLIQLREIMSGKAKDITDDRQIPKFIKLKVWTRDKGICTECSSKEKLHYHHIIRFSEGGRHTEDNIKLLCASCHAKEHEGEKAYYMLKKMAEG